MKIIDHGKWIPYKPDLKDWPNAPANALFCRRESDSVDWYRYVNPPATNFEPDSVKIAFMFHEVEQQWIIGPSYVDATMIFPANQHVREVIDFGSIDEEEIIAFFRNKVIDPETNEILGDRQLFGPPPPSPEEQRVMNDYPKIILDLIARVEKLERSK